eukprot:CAMPEP_0113578682 /NCGR_PEP_ID=MMETSP0015_2-20120614/29630_1 /TAXON_ID=2838 /ORGANISM="Odontella" /LENGTH=293 /DNA_ID=CAMNT_0000482541 /DNA_START=34 /DNA_END=915 /DNA_ORIENTATION=+ /assembly_acc=CAM_ASM_000160
MKTAFRRVRCRVEKTAAISLVAFAFAPQSIIRTNVPLLHVLASVSSSTIRYCNRGYCYTRREPEHHHGLSQHDLVLDPSLRTDHHGSRKKPSLHDTRSGIDFCTDAHGHVMDCELYSILGMDRDELEAEFEALESTGPSARSGSGRRGVGKEDEESQNKEEKKMDDLGEGPESQEEGIIDVDDHDFDSPRVSGHVSWKDRPVRGKCYDNDSGYIFECDLVQILDDGRVLIEDHSHGGVIAAIAKSGYHTRRKKSNMEEEIRTPKVLNGAAGPLDTGDPAEDFRTNVFLNLEGI